MKENSFSHAQKNETPFHAFGGQGKSQRADSFRSPSGEQDSSVPVPFFIELVQSVKSYVRSIEKLTQMTRGKFRDKAFDDHFNLRVKEDIEKIGFLISNVVDYIKISYSVSKTNTVHVLIEEFIKKQYGLLEQKKIRLYKKLEEGLPEVVVPEEQLRFILNAIVQYAMARVPLRGSLGLFTRSLILTREPSGGPKPFEKNGKYIEILLIYTGDEKPQDHFKTLVSDPLKEEGLALELKLVNEIAQRNRGKMKFGKDEKDTKTWISLRFPVERRKVITFRPPK